MDPSVLLRTGTLVLLHVIEGQRVQLDLDYLTVGPKFMGVKLIPPGIHFVSVEATERAPGDEGSVSKMFLSFQAGDVIVLKWSPSDSTLIRADPEEEERFSLGALGLLYHTIV